MSSEAARLQAVRRYEILDTPPDGAFDRITRLAARLLHVPIAIVSIVDEDRIWFKSKFGLDVQQIPRCPGLCSSAILGDEPWLLTDASRDPRSLSNPLVVGEFPLRFYLGIPLRTADGHNLGTLCVIDKEPRNPSTEQIEALQDLASIVVDELEIRLHALTTVHNKDMLIREIHHRIRNNLQVVSSLMHLQERLAPSDAKMLFRQAAQRIETMALLHHEFYSGKKSEAVNIKEHLEKLLRLTIESFGSSNTITVSVAGDEIEVPLELATPLSLLVTELASNSCKHAFHDVDDCQITVTVEEAGDEVSLIISDNGVGFDAMTATKGMGSRLIDSFVIQLRGTLERLSSAGCRYSLRFPLPDL